MSGRACTESKAAVAASAVVICCIRSARRPLIDFIFSLLFFYHPYHHPHEEYGLFVGRGEHGQFMFHFICLWVGGNFAFYCTRRLTIFSLSRTREQTEPIVVLPHCELDLEKLSVAKSSVGRSAIPSPLHNTQNLWQSQQAKE